MADAAGSPASPFRSREQMTHQAGKIGLLELSFTETPDRTIIYAHSAYIIASSGVLRCILEDQDEAPQHLAKKARTNSSVVPFEPIEADRVIPLDDEKTSAWETALSMLYPSTMLQAKVTWDNAEDLLLLADKYDMPVIMDKVKSFLGSYVDGAGHTQTQLSAGINHSTVFNLLKVFSRCGLDDFATLCIGFIARNELTLPADYLICGLQPKHVEHLYKAVRQHLDTKLSDNANNIRNLTSELATTKHQLTSAERQVKREKDKTKLQKFGTATCSRCKEPWYWLLNKRKVSPICMCCGVVKRTGYHWQE